VEVARATQLREPLSVVILDLDHFKKVNDQWGHPTGDLVLKTAAQVLRQNIRECDSLGRYGGEEFIIIIPNADQAEAQKIIERCRIALAQTNILSESQVLINVTASFGVVNVTHSIEQMIEPYTLIKTADEALYIAKHNGRNRIETKVFAQI
jgi:diguanylate cyclase (GGDEF)-like protein